MIVVSDHGFKSSGKLPSATQLIAYGVLGLKKRETLDEPVNVGQNGCDPISGCGDGSAILAPARERVGTRRWRPGSAAAG